MKILLVFNNKMRWADVFRAEELQKQWTEDEVDILDRRELPDPDKYDVIHFLYGGALTKSKDYILNNKDKVFTSSVSRRSLDGMWDDRKTLLELYKASRCCVCQNPEILSILEGLAPGVNAVYIPNGVDEKLFERKFVAGFVGAKASNVHKGFYEAKEACDELGIELKVAHEHMYEHEDMPNFYKEIDVLLIPSLSEGCHNPTMEALAMNIPVISTDVGIANKLDGVRLVLRSANSVKGELLKMMPRTQILKEYTWSEIAKKYHQLYERQ